MAHHKHLRSFLVLAILATATAWTISPGAWTPTREVRRGCLDSHRQPAFSAPRLSINRRQAGASVVAALPFFFPGSKEAQASGVAKPTNEVVKTVNGIRCEFAEGGGKGGRGGVGEGGRGKRESQTRHTICNGRTAPTCFDASTGECFALTNQSHFSCQQIVRHKRLGGGDIIVSEIGLGTQRWVSKDFNAPDEALCKEMMNKAILEGGVNLIDTAEQYPIPSDFTRPEGLCEEVIGRWLKEGGPSRREKAVIATKITGGGRINKKSIISACEGSLQRLQTGEMPHPSADVLQLHAV
jgi:hypothetical protein